jgi:lipocalin-like protein
MKQIAGYILLTTMLLSCGSSAPPEKKESSGLPLEGTWELISGTTISKGDTVNTDYTKGQQMIKIINADHFAFLLHDLTRGKDSAIYSSGGGHYTLSGNQYTEYLEYCSDRQWEGNKFPFTVSISNDTLTQSGIEKVEGAGVDRMNIERYKRVKK